MTDFLSFDAGREELANNGLPATCYFLLSTKPCSGVGAHEIAGTGYARQSQAVPFASDADPADVAFAPMGWDTGGASDWPSDVRSVVLVTSADDSGTAIAAWNLYPGGVARDMSSPGSTLTNSSILSLA